MDICSLREKLRMCENGRKLKIQCFYAYLGIWSVIFLKNIRPVVAEITITAPKSSNPFMPNAFWYTIEQFSDNGK